jgi:antitoxin (DNA-binding transcriptional repressor) of toxin-antitoxin stability system
VLDCVEHGERLVVTWGREPIAEIIPIDRTECLLARWVRDRLVAEQPASGYAKAGAWRAPSRRLPPVASGRTATELLLEMREDER